MSRFSVRGVPWSFVGTKNVEQCKTASEVMEAAGLNWEVGKAELFAKMPIEYPAGSDEFLDVISESKKLSPDSHFHGKDIYNPVEDMFATYRKDKNIPLGIVKQKYTVVQNSDAFKFFDDVIGKDSAIWQTAGYFGNGSRIFVSAKIPDTITVHGDPIDQYLVFTNSHNGSSGVNILFTPIRIICQNTLNAAIRTATNIINIKHTKSVHKTITIAHEVLGIAKQQGIQFKTVADQLAEIKISDSTAAKYICEHFMTTEELEKLKFTGHTYGQIVARDGGAFYDVGLSTRKLNAISSAWEYYFEGAGQKEIIGTAWGAANAISGYYSNVDTSTVADKRMDSLLYGDRSRNIAKAFDNALNLAV